MLVREFHIVAHSSLITIGPANSNDWAVPQLVCHLGRSLTKTLSLFKQFVRLAAANSRPKKRKAGLPRFGYPGGLKQFRTIRLPPSSTPF
jgi:hypothetical protein